MLEKAKRTCGERKCFARLQTRRRARDQTALRRVVSKTCVQAAPGKMPDRAGKATVSCAALSRSRKRWPSRRIVADLHAERAPVAIAPVVVGHLAPFGGQPIDVLQIGSRHDLRTGQISGGGGKRRDCGGRRSSNCTKSQQVRIDLLATLPIAASSSRCPGNRRCCCRSACARTRRPSAASACRSRRTPSRAGCASADARSARIVGIVGLALDAAIPGKIMRVAVLVVLAVRLVVPLVVADEVFAA